ncbi:tigger transposable element-derived protein 1-like isoform X1 [Macrobrachium rosenbergii]|uniref:tigger transposable element-derived protein 1-like isoform X1 n=1 Tax=Macrobrachium rosenbergii TaxID=79674 RepID=UPI0034D50E00
MSDTLDPSKLKAAELRAELEARGLDTEGNMPVLVGRLREALQQADDEEETDVKEELGNGYDGSMKIEEIDVKEELVEPKQEPSDTEDRRREKRIVHSWSRSPDSEKQRPEVEEATVEDEPEYDRSAVLSDWCIKREPDTGHEGPPPRAFSANELAEQKQEPFKERRGEKRQASSHQGTPRSKRYCHGSTDKHTDDDPDYDKEAVILDWYNRDLSLIIDKETFLSAKPMTSDGFAYVWHGVRARYGFLRGRLFYEVKVDHLAIPLLEGEQHPHGLRCGWSIDDAGMVLGEEPFSYGYGGTAKASTNLKFKDYGQPFGKGDVIGCYLDMDSEPITMSFSVNGRNFGKCYEVSHRSLQGKALFPHILTKNYTFKVNFGSEYPWFQPMARYRFVGQIPLEERVLGSQGPKTRQDSESSPKMPPKSLAPSKASGKEPECQEKFLMLQEKVARQDSERVLRTFTMAPKRQNGVSDGSAPKKRKAITMVVKLDIIKRSEKGETNTEIGRTLGFSRTTVQSIVKDKQRILEHMKGAASMKETVITKQRSANLVEMETLLLTWLKDQNQRHVPVSLSVIQEKARELHKAVVKKNGEGSASEEFVASRGWFNRFKARANLRSLKLQGEAASADQEAADRLPSAFAEIIKEGGYSAEQVFNVDETGLFWKRMPGLTDISKEEKSSGYKASKERLTLLLGSNASGDFKLKPLLVSLAENPRALKGVFKTQLPVIWKSNEKAWVTLLIFEDWFVYHFVPAVERYCASKGLPFKVLLVLDSALAHPSNLNCMTPNVKVAFLPPNMTSLLQPMDQGVIANFKAYYLRRTVRNALRAIEGNKELTLEEFWKSYSILDAIKNIASAWDEIKQTNLNGAWQKLCPQLLRGFVGFEKVEDLETVTKKIVWYSKKLNLEVKAENVTELLASHGEELTSEDLIDLEKQMIEEEEEAPPKFRELTVECLTSGLSHIEKGLALLEAEDPNMERFMKVRRGVMDCLTFYRKTLKEKQMKKSLHPRLDSYFKKSSTPSAIRNLEVMPIPDSPEPEPEPSPAPSDSQAPADSTS